MAECVAPEFNKEIRIDGADHVLIDGGPYRNGFIDLESVSVHTDLGLPSVIQIVLDESEGGAIAAFLPTKEAKLLASAILEAIAKCEEHEHGQL